ncbi:hypothetical protein AKJ09_05931 [Labilithrix luteola]|uniref:Uncharacterized protein n=1 Tax=Labilithrix luteola TaxID=1391654 RepID=A0A0K1Q0L0_9BACT|nr:hypothetical protein [Labilithrix luteola]AKU99267.1 hypothetical protein AKJ09_05931 [Labilithrix luteola]
MNEKVSPGCSGASLDHEYLFKWEGIGVFGAPRLLLPTLEEAQGHRRQLRVET